GGVDWGRGWTGFQTKRRWKHRRRRFGAKRGRCVRWQHHCLGRIEVSGRQLPRRPSTLRRLASVGSWRHLVLRADGDVQTARIENFISTENVLTALLRVYKDAVRIRAEILRFRAAFGSRAGALVNDGVRGRHLHWPLASRTGDRPSPRFFTSREATAARLALDFHRHSLGSFVETSGSLARHKRAACAYLRKTY